MSGRPILDDTDFNYTEIMKGRLENVSSLPTGLSTEEKGYGVFYKEKIWVWDGFSWNSWGSVPWTYELNDSLDALNPRQESSVINATSAFLHSKHWHITKSEGYSDNIARTLGTLHFIGATGTINDWDEIKGRRFVYSALNGSWFNIKNLSGESLPSAHKKINTRMETDITEVIKAEFIYDHYRDEWALVSFERKPSESSNSESWFRRFDIYPTQKLPNTVFQSDVPEPAEQGLPYDGYYKVDLFIQTREYEADLVTRNTTEVSQLLEISSPITSWFRIDESGNFEPEVENPLPKWYNNSLQGSAIIRVQEGICGLRKISWRATLPNGAYKQIESGYIHVQYLGVDQGRVCYD